MMVLPALYLFLKGMAIFVMSLVMHEIGHVFMYRYHSMRWIKVNVNLRECVVGDEEDYLMLNTTQKLDIYLAGIFLGLVTLCYLMSFIGAIGWVLIIPYFMACFHDLKMINLIMGEYNNSISKED